MEQRRIWSTYFPHVRKSKDKPRENSSCIADIETPGDQNDSPPGELKCYALHIFW